MDQEHNKQATVPVLVIGQIGIIIVEVPNVDNSSGNNDSSDNSSRRDGELDS